MKPLYEDDESRANEAMLKPILERLWKAALIKLSMEYHADFLAVREATPVAVIEVKRRKTNINAFPCHILSLHKALMCLLFARLMNVKFMLVVKWDDRVAYVEIRPDHLDSVKHQITTFKNDPGDTEPCILIPIEQFKTIAI